MFTAPFDRQQMATVVCMLGLIGTVLVTALAGLDPDVGVFAFAFGALLAFINPVSGKTAVSNIDWSTVLLVGGIVNSSASCKRWARSPCSARRRVASERRWLPA